MAGRPKRSKQQDEEKIEEKPREEKIHELKVPVDFLSTGSINLNLAASQKADDGGWARGRVVNIVGDSSSGKTLTALEACANAYYFLPGTSSHNFQEVEKVSIVYNNVEGVMDFPVDLMYGEDFLESVEWCRTGTVQEFGRDFFPRIDKIESGEALIYVIDSWDALDSEEEQKAFQESIDKGKPMEGSYDLGKQKYGSKRFFKHLCSKIEDNDGRVKKDVTLFIISQVRAKIGVTFGEKRARVGGDALNFYTHQVCWLREVEKIKKTSQGEEIVVGITSEANFKRNKVALPFRKARFDITFNRGIDDVTSMIKWIWGPKSKEVEFNGEKFKRYPSLVKYIEDNDLEQEIITMSSDKWYKIEEAVRVERKPRFPDVKGFQKT